MNEKESMIVINPGKKGIVYENAGEFETSIFARAYQKAQKLVEQIISENERIERSDYAGTLFQSDKQVDNIITFIGRRGTGKTSSMLSFMDSLKRRKQSWGRDVDRNKVQAEFICLEWIDASILEKNEDIFETVLAKMFGEFRKNNESGNLDYDNRVLYQKFEQIYKRISNLKRSGLVSDDREVMDILNALSRSSEIRENFTELIKSYVRFMGKVYANEGFYQRDTYLVVAIDDLDLNEKAYEVLEQIHRYLMVPGMIVLIAVNYEELLLRYEEQYVNIYRQIPESIIQNLGARAMQKGEEYLEKILPPYMRIYLPSLKKMDYALREKRKVEIDGKKYSIREWTFALIWKKTGVFFYPYGEKRHFLEPKTLRNLSNHFQKYSLMNDMIGHDGEKCWEDYDENYNHMVDDILFRLASDSLPDKERKLFIKWSEEKAIRRGKLIIHTVTELLPEPLREDHGNKRNAVVSMFPEEYKRYGYSYGELIRAFYCIVYKGIFDEKLIQILLVHYTVVFSRVFEYYKKDEMNEAMMAPERKNRKKLQKLMGQSFGGSLGKYILPKVRIILNGNNHLGIQSGSGKGKEETRQGNMERGNPLNLYFGQNLNNTSNGGVGYLNLGARVYEYNENVIIHRFPEEEFFERDCQRNTEEEVWDRYCDFLNSERMQAITVLMFFFSGFAGDYHSQEAYLLTIEKPSGEQNREYSLKFSESNITFNILNFVKNAFLFEETIQTFYLAFGKALCEAGFVSNDFNEKLEKNIETYMRQEKKRGNEGAEKSNMTIVEQFYRWSKIRGGLALPIYNFDITYNLFQQLLEKLEDMPGNIVTIEDCYQEILKLFDYIGDELERQDTFYNNLKTNQSEISYFHKSFQECPVVKYICVDHTNMCHEIWNNYLNASPVENDDENVWTDI